MARKIGIGIGLNFNRTIAASGGGSAGTPVGLLLVLTNSS